MTNKKKRGFFERLNLRVYLWYMRRNRKLKESLESVFEHDNTLSETQQLAIKIFDKAIHTKETNLLIAPLSNTYYAESNDIFIVLQGRELTMVNGKYQYNIIVREKDAWALAYKFKRVVEARRKKMEKKMLTNTNTSLQNILDGLGKKE